ncbi:MAG: hypothetical protein QXM16_05860 [Nitrososphaerota archaeon]
MSSDVADPSRARGAFGEGPRGGEGRCPTTASPPNAAVCPDGRVSGGRGGVDTKGVHKPLGREKRRFFADIHRMANKNRSRKSEENFHIYTVDGINFARTCKITDIPAGEGDELYVDCLPVELTDEFVEVLRRGVKILYLRRLTILAKKRKELQLSKTSRNDIKLLMALDPKWFREVDENYLVMRRLTAAFRSLLRTHASILNKAKALQDAEKNVLMKSARAVEESMMELASSIVSEAEKRYPYFNKVVEVIGITGENHLLAREALAEIMPYIERTRSFKRLKRFFGLFEAKNRVNKIYSKTARYALSRLTAAVLKNTHHRARDEEQLLKRIWKTVKETRERLGAPA